MVYNTGAQQQAVQYITPTRNLDTLGLVVARSLNIVGRNGIPPEGGALQSVST